jgi:hypothetical protein
LASAALIWRHRRTAGQAAQAESLPVDAPVVSPSADSTSQEGK